MDKSAFEHRCEDRHPPEAARSGQTEWITVHQIVFLRGKVIAAFDLNDLAFL